MGVGAGSTSASCCPMGLGGPMRSTPSCGESSELVAWGGVGGGGGTVPSRTAAMATTLTATATAAATAWRTARGGGMVMAAGESGWVRVGVAAAGEPGEKSGSELLSLPLASPLALLLLASLWVAMGRGRSTRRSGRVARSSPPELLPDSTVRVRSRAPTRLAMLPCCIGRLCSQIPRGQRQG